MNLKLLIPQLMIVGDQPNVLWGLAIHEGLIFAVEKNPTTEGWNVLVGIPAKLAEYFPILVSQYYPLLSTIGYPKLKLGTIAKYKKEENCEIETNGQDVSITPKGFSIGLQF